VDIVSAATRGRADALTNGSRWSRWQAAIEAVEQGKTASCRSWSKTIYWMKTSATGAFRASSGGDIDPAGIAQAAPDQVARTKPQACAIAGREPHADEDVLDTCFHRGCGRWQPWLADRTRDCALLSQRDGDGYDILFFWVARMMMAGLHFMKRFLPQVYCTPW